MIDESNKMATRIAVVGMAGRFPGSHDLDEFWHNLRHGVESITRFSEDELRAAGVPANLFRDPAYVPAKGVVEDADQFDASLFGMSAGEAERTDPQHRVFLECALTALENAGYAAPQSDRLVGVFAGCGASGYAPLLRPTTTARTAADYQHIVASDKDFLATRVAYKLDLRGPCLSVQSACSTSLVAVSMACQSLLTYQCDVALAGGVSISVPLRAGYLYQEGMVLSPDGHCRAFDANAAGTVPADGVGIVVLRRLEDALADGDNILAVLCGFGLGNDGANKQSFSAPGIDGQVAAIRQALAMAQLTPSNISYIETHGTGTPLGDPVEVSALMRVFEDSTLTRPACALGSVKSNIGHTDAAAGIAGLIKVILMLRHRELVPSLHFRRANPHLNLDSTPFFVNTELRPWQCGGPRRAGVSSFGIGGTNAHLIAEEAPPQATSQESNRPQLLALSAATAQALTSLQGNMAQYLIEHPQTPLADIAFSLQTGRRSHRLRQTIVASSHADAVAMLADSSVGERALRSADEGIPAVAFLFPGHGSGYPDMGRTLYEAWPSFREDVDAGLDLFHAQQQVDLRRVLFPVDGDRARAATAIAHARLGQPAMFLIEWALGRLLLSWGIRPRALLGHSLGEYAAACLSGVFTLEQGLWLVSERGNLMARTPEGAMLAVSLSSSDVTPYLSEDVSLAAINGPKSCVVAGPVNAISTLEHRLNHQDIPHHRLAGHHAFHSRLMEDIVEPLVTTASKVASCAPQIPLLSSSTAHYLTDTEVTNPRYWGTHLRSVVRFEEALRRLCSDPALVLIEVGPGDTLAALARRHPSIQVQDVLTTLPRQRDLSTGTVDLLKTLGRLWQRDVIAKLPNLHANEYRRRVSLPSYPFQRQRYWRDSMPSASATPVQAQTALAGTRDLDSWFYRPEWKIEPLTVTERLATGETLIFADDYGLATQIKAALPEGKVTLVQPGDRFCRTEGDRYTLRSADPADYDLLLSELKAQRRLPDHIVWLWDITDGVSTDKRPTDAFLCKLRLVRALGRLSTPRPQQFLVVTCDAHPVAQTPVQHPQQAMALAFMRVLPEEYPHLAFAAVDLARADITQEGVGFLATQLLGELANLAQMRQSGAVAYRKTARYTLTFVQTPVRAKPPGVSLRQRGTYLITGGLGGIGLVLARHLIRTAKARVVLTSRTGLPPRPLWDDILSAAGSTPAADSMAGRIRSILELEREGGEVVVVATDVASEPEMRNLKATVRDHLGQLNGVIHTAGVATGGVIQRQTEEDVLATLAPKLQGSLLLADMVREQPLDFFALCSSLTAVTGGFGQVAYAAANCFLDALANVLRDRGIPAISINWDGWNEVGAAARAARINPADVGRTAKMVHPLLGTQILKTPALYQQRLDPARDWIFYEHRLYGRPTLPGTAFVELARAAAAHALGDQPIMLHDVVLVSPLRAVDASVIELWTSVQQNGSTLSIVVYSRTAGTAEPAKPHLQCTASRIEQAHSSSPALSQILAERREERSAAALLEQRRAVVDLGARWQCLQHLWQGPNHAVAELALAANFVSEDTALALHPAVLDMGAGCAVHLASQEHLPYSYGSISIYQALRGRIYSHATLIERTLRSTRFDVSFYDDHGSLLVQIKDYFLMAPTHDKTMEHTR